MYLPDVVVALLTLATRSCEWTKGSFSDGTRCAEEAMAQCAASSKAGGDQ